MNRISIRLILILLTSWIFFAQSSWASGCNCEPLGVGVPGTCSSYKPFNNSFIGTVIDIENSLIEKNPGVRTGQTRYRFRVDENIKGFEEKEVDLYSGDHDCSYHFQMGQSYYVDPYKDSGDGKLKVLDCGQTQLASDLGPLLAELRQRRDGKLLDSIEIILIKKQQPYASTLYDFYNHALPDVIVELRGENLAQTAQTNQEGVYRFDDLPSGTYHFTAKLPPNYVLEQSSPSDPLPSITITNEPCYKKVIHALPTSRIRGRVFDPHGAPLQNADVALFSRGRYKDTETGWWQVQTDKNGYYEFEHVTPGLFLVVFNNANKSDATSPYPRTFYPSAPDFDTAGGITIGNDELYEGVYEVLNADIHVLPVANPNPTPKY